jgi:hypothetical protein
VLKLWDFKNGDIMNTDGDAYLECIYPDICDDLLNQMTDPNLIAVYDQLK